MKGRAASSPPARPRLAPQMLLCHDRVELGGPYHDELSPNSWQRTVGRLASYWRSSPCRRTDGIEAGGSRLRYFGGRRPYLYRETDHELRLQARQWRGPRTLHQEKIRSGGVELGGHTGA